MKIGVVGVGVVGGALASYLKARDHEVVLDDPPRGIEGDCSEVEALFVCVPVETIADDKGRIIQDTSILKQVLKKYAPALQKNHAPVFIRSTVLPKTCDSLAKHLKIRVYSCPEFLTEREADATFAEQDVIVGTGEKVNADMHRLLDAIFPDKQLVLVTNREAELAKYAHNAMGAMKVNFFNLVRKYAARIGANYDNVLAGVLLSGYINKDHTQVPGPDGKYGFGGKCFPKDTLALVGELKRMGLQSGSLELVVHENFLYRSNFMGDFKVPLIKYLDETPASAKILFDKEVTAPV